MNDAKILVVDDEPTLSEVISYNLRQAGYTTVTAADLSKYLSLTTSQLYQRLSLITSVRQAIQRLQLQMQMRH